MHTYTHLQVILPLVNEVDWTHNPFCVASSTLAVLRGEGFHVSTTVTVPELTRQPNTSSFSCNQYEEEGGEEN